MDDKAVLEAIERGYRDVTAALASAQGAITQRFDERCSKLESDITDLKKRYDLLMFGEHGDGGVLRKVVDLNDVVCGLDGHQDDRGLIGEVTDLKTCIKGKDGMANKMTELETKQGKQNIWNISSLPPLIAAILAFLKSFFGSN